MSVAARRTPREGDDEERPLRRREYDLLVASGAFDDERVELLDGRIVPRSPQGSLHRWVVRRLIEAFAPRLAGRAVLQVAASESSEVHVDPVGGRYERTLTERSGALAPEGFPDLAVDVGRLVGAGAP